MQNLIDIKLQVNSHYYYYNYIYLHFLFNTQLLLFKGDALIEPGEDPEVIRAKYFIRDEFLVRMINFQKCSNFKNAYFKLYFFFSVYQQLVEMENITAIHILLVQLTLKTLREYLMTAGT